MTDHMILRVTIKILFAPILLFALYVQFHGEYGAGGGFQAGVIFAAAFVLHAIGFGLEATQRVLSPRLLPFGMAIGAMLYSGTGLATVLLGANAFDYAIIQPDSHHFAGRHLGIFLVELGVGMAVSSSMLMIFYVFAGREPEPADDAW